MPQEFGVYLSVATLLALIGAIVTVVRRFTHVEAKVDNESEFRQMLEAQMENVTREVQRIERDNLNRADVLRHETGEVGAAIRQRVHDVEIATRDRVDKVATDIREQIERLGDRLEAKITTAMRRD